MNRKNGMGIAFPILQMQEQPIRKVLIIDDDDNFLHAMKKILERAGFIPTAISNPLDAIPLIQREYFPLIITDLRMPGMDGMELITRIMNINPSSKVILITAFGDNHVRQEAMDKGVFGYLTKPVKREEVVELAERAVGVN